MNAEEVKKVAREKEVPEYKKKIVSDLAGKIKDSKTVLIASTSKLPSSQFHSIKKNLRGKADIRVARKSAVKRAIDASGKTGIRKLKDNIGSDVALFFSDLDAFELSGLLSENESPAKAKAGDIAPEDIDVEPGPTELVPGPAISELGSVGLKVAVENGKLAIKQSATLAKEGDEISDKLASVLGKLNIAPMKVGFEPVAAYSKEDDKVYVGIKINKQETLDELRIAIGKSKGFALNIDYITEETVKLLISKAGIQEKAIASHYKEDAKTEEKPAEEKPAEEEKKEEVKEDKAEDKSAQDSIDETKNAEELVEDAKNDKDTKEDAN